MLKPIISFEKNSLEQNWRRWKQVHTQVIQWIDKREKTFVYSLIGTKVQKVFIFSNKKTASYRSSLQLLHVYSVGWYELYEPTKLQLYIFFLLWLHIILPCSSTFSL